jgi:hypothetical protein
MHEPTKEAFYAHLRANPPYRHKRWLAYVIGSSRTGGRHSTVPQFGEWLDRKHPKEFAQLFTQWTKTLNKTPQTA